MTLGLIGTKLGMTREFIKNGQSVPVTVIKIEKGRVLDIITKEKRGYSALRVGFFKIKNSKSKIVKFNNLNHFRDFISVSDIVRVIYKLYKLEKKGIFNLGSGKKINLKDIARYVAKKYNKEVNFVDNEKISYLIANNKKIEKIYKKKLSNPFK